jgi:hypothetical protein
MKTVKRPGNKSTTTQICNYTRAAAILTISLFLLTGCASNTAVMAQQSPVPVEQATPDAATDSEKPAVTTPAAQVAEQTAAPDQNASSAPYQIATAEFNQDSIHIKYPHISGLEAASVEKAINDLIKSDIWDSQVGETIDTYQDETIKLDLDMGYEVTLSTDDILSVLYTGSAYIEGGVHPSNMFHAITLDLKSGKRLYLSDFMRIDGSLIKKLKQSKSIHNFVTDNEIQDKTQLAQLRDGLSNEIQDQDEKFMIWDLKNQRDSAFYLTKDALVIRTYVSHAAGDYALVDLPGQYTVNATSQFDDTLCLNTEKLVVSFQLRDGGKTVSVCMDTDEGYLVYRFGTKENIELEYPANKAQAWDCFTYDYSTIDAHDSLQFENGGFRYEVYQQDYTASTKLKVGVKVTELATGKESDMAGLPESLIGYWYDLQGNKNVHTAQ